MKIFICLKINQLHFYKQPYTLIDIKEWVYQKFFADSVVIVHRPLQYCGVRFEKRTHLLRLTYLPPRSKSA